MSGSRRFLDFFGKMGLLARGDRPIVVDLTGREWGPQVAGLSLSARQVVKQDSDELPTLSVAIRNAGPKALGFMTPGWLTFYAIDLTGPDGAPVPLSPYGSQLKEASQTTDSAIVSLQPEGVSETILPVGSLYTMRSRSEYQVRVSCQLPDGTALVSNDAAVTP